MGFVQAGALAALLLLGACASPRAAPQAPIQQAPFTRASDINVTAPTGYAFSPDGQRVLVSANDGGVFNVYAQALAGGDATALTASTDADIQAVSYFPSDERVLLTRADRLLVRDTDGALRDLAPGESPSFVGWRQDGGVFWTLTARANGFRLDEYDAANLQRQTLFQSDAMAFGALSRDGRWLALRQTASNSDANLFLVDLNVAAPDLNVAAPTPRLITAHEGAIQYGVFEFAADSRSLIYSTNENGPHIQAWRYDLASGEKTPSMEAQASVTQVASSPSAHYRLFMLGEGADADAVLIDQQSDRALPFSRDIRDVRFNRDETRIAFRLAADPWPMDVFVADIDGRNIQRVVHAAGAESER